MHQRVPLQRGALGFAATFGTLLCACGSTEDSLGYNDPISLAGNGGASSDSEYPNAFADDLGLTDAEIDDKLQAAFDQLFYGDPATEAIYFPVDPDGAYIEDFYNADTRTDAVGYAMMLTVQLDRQDEFDRILSWASSNMRFSEGPFAGLLAWSCNTDGTECATTPDPNGTAYIATALIFAEARWGNTGAFAYAEEAEQLLHLMLHLEDENGGVVDDAHNLFDAGSDLVVYSPSGEGLAQTAPSAHLPAFYEIWADVTSEDSAQWRRIAAASRAFLRAAANPETGLVPSRADLDASPLAGVEGNFGADAYRVPMNLAIDQIWFEADSWQVEHADRWLGFFADQGLDTYLAGYTLDGTTVTLDYRSPALRAMNGTAAMIATLPARSDFIEDVWNLEVPTGDFRYYDGILYLLSLITLSGNFQIYLP